jgi:EpsI family protein
MHSSASTISNTTLRADRNSFSTPELAAIALILAAFIPTILSFPPMWLDKGGQGFVAAGFAAYLLWRDRAQLFPRGRGIAEASLIIVGISALWLVAYVLNVQVVHQGTLPLVLLGWLLATRGWAALIAVLPVAGVFFLAVPVWGMLIAPLQAATVVVNGLLLKVTGVQAVIDGYHIQIESGIFLVAEGCAGLNYFETGLLISTMYALLFLVTWRARAIAVAIGVALAIVSNWLRVFGLIVIGDITEMKSPLIADHGLYGWILFAISMLVFFAIMRKVEKIDASRTTQLALEPTPTVALTVGGFAQEPPRAAQGMQGLPLPTLAALVGPLAFVLLGGRSTTGEAPETPLGIVASGWNVSAMQVTVADTNGGVTNPDSAVSRSPIKYAEWRPQFAGADEYRTHQYVQGAAQLRVDRVLYREQGQGRELVSGMNRVTDADQQITSDVVGPIDETGRLLNSTISRTDRGAMLTWYWYSVGGFTTHSSTRAKLMELIAFAKQDSPPAELIAVSAFCEASSCTEASKLLYKLVAGREAPAAAPQ